MIVSIAELRAALGLADSITAGDLATLNLVQPKANSAIKDALGYNPETLRATEYYPRAEAMVKAASARYEIAGSRAVLVSTANTDYLQLARLPVRTVHALYVDSDGRFGQRGGAFGAGTELTAGTDFYLETEQDGLCHSGCLIATTGWPVTPGSIKVDYTAGYTADEFTGRASSGIDAGGIHEAVLITAVQAFHQLKAKQKTRAGFVPGPIISERMGDYSYTLDSASAAEIAGFHVSVPQAALDKLAKFRHFGQLLT